jgi:hypothetical protein
VSVLTMSIETGEGVHRHPYHLGTVVETAMSFVIEQLRKPEVRSVALREGPKLIGIYDFRDLPGNED